MVIDSRKVQLFQQQSILGDIAVDAGTVLTQIEVLKSANVSQSVIKSLHLTDDPEFVGGKSGLIGAIAAFVSKLFGGGDTPSDSQLKRRALQVFDKDRTVDRVGLTYVMDISFESHDPAKAARIANAIVDAYILDQLEAKYQATRRASVWLQTRIKQLRTQASSAQRAVVNFKQDHNIVDTGGQLMNEQELAEVNSQLTLAHAATAEAKARLDNINQIMKQPIPDGSVADALNSQVIIALRAKYLELAAREAIWAKKYGPNHLAVLSLRNQMLELRKNISDEMKKIAEAYQNNYDVALARENSIKSRLDKTVAQSQITDQAKIQLRELQSSADSYQTMYDNFLQRYMEAVQQESFPITEARLISAALPPLAHNHPKTIVVLPLTLIAGLMLSFGVAFVREMTDRVFRTGAEVESKLQVNCLAMMPAIQLEGAEPPASDHWPSKIVALFEAMVVAPFDRRRGGLRKKRPSGDAQPAMAGSPERAPQDNLTPAARQIPQIPGLLRHVLDQPFSQFTEALRSVKVTIDLNGAVQTNKIIGVTSSIPNEGKSTIAANLAELIAFAGARTILVDADLRNPSLSRHFAPDTESGFVDIVSGRTDLESVLWKDAASGLDFIPVGNATKLMHSHDILGSDSTRKLFARLRDAYDYVIVDFAPLAPVVDTRASSHFIDSYVYVVEWGRTQADVVEHSLSNAHEIYDRLLGVVLNKADMDTLRRYDHYRSNYYYKKYYSRYGYGA